MDPRIRIHTKMSWIRNNENYNYSGEKEGSTKEAEERRHAMSTVPVPEAGKWKPRPVLLLDVVLLVFQAHVVARQQQSHAHATLARRVDAAPRCLLHTVLINTCTTGTVYRTGVSNLTSCSHLKWREA
jgi:hypothetical protein